MVDAVFRYSDKLGSCKVRWGFSRISYRIRPGLYAVGYTSDRSMILVTANYKMSFDILRSQLIGINAWILVLDTRGVNVWCAAGKGTFGNDEIVNRIKAVQLKKIVSH